MKRFLVFLFLFGCSSKYENYLNRHTGDTFYDDSSHEPKRINTIKELNEKHGRKCIKFLEEIGTFDFDYKYCFYKEKDSENCNYIESIGYICERYKPFYS